MKFAENRVTPYRGPVPGLSGPAAVAGSGQTAAPATVTAVMKKFNGCFMYRKLRVRLCAVRYMMPNPVTP